MSKERFSRRRVIGTVSLTPVTVLSGCSYGKGVNRDLELVNKGEFDREVFVEVWKFDGTKPEGKGETVFAQELEIPSRDSIERRVFTKSQFIVRAEMNERIVEFPTRPICNDAFTRVVLAPDGELIPEVRGCGD